MYIYLQPLIVWPRREEVLKTMPEMFKNDFRRCICIIDCFEVFCERPSDLMARAQTYSNYKHHNTIKFLIPTSPRVQFHLFLEVGEVGCLTSILVKTVVCLPIFNQETKY